MKKFRIIGIILCLTMLLCAFVSCGGDGGNVGNNGGDNGDVGNNGGDNGGNDTGNNSGAGGTDAEQSYTITYDANGGEASKTTQKVTYDQDYTLIVPTKYGYTFDGWFEGTTKYENGKWNVKGNVTLVAKWTANTYTVIFDENGGDAIEDLTVTYDAAYTLTTPERIGYTFMGWFDGTTKYEGGVWDKADNLTLTADWEINTYTISYENDGGEHSNVTSYTVEDAISLTAPTKTGYTFAGWTFEGQSTPVLDLTIEKGTVGNKTYKANFDVNVYTITYDTDQGTLTETTQSVEYGSNYTLAVPTKDGYFFLGWFDGTTKFESGQWNRTDDVTLTAKWACAAWIGDIKNPSKVNADTVNRTIVFTQERSTTSSPSANFYQNETKITGSAWAISGTINVKTVSGISGHIYFTATKDSSNVANLILNRRVAGVNGAYRNITINGVRTPSGSGNEKTYDRLTDTTDWTGEFVFMFYNGHLALYLKEANGDFVSVASYKVDWEDCAPSIMVKQNANVTISNLTARVNDMEVKALYNSLENILENPIASANVLFIGNSATYTNDLPGTLSRLARKAGYNVTVNSVTLSGGKLSQHADSSTDHGKKVLSEIEKGYDIVFIQEVTSCITTEANKAATLNAAKILDAAIDASGAQTAIYVRPPTGKDLGGFNSYNQCIEYDKLFNNIAAEIGADNVYVNRACAYVIENNLNVNLWGPDNAHLSVEGVYLASCVFFATLFNTSASVLDYDGLPADLATTLQTVADAVVLEGYIMQ